MAVTPELLMVDPSPNICGAKGAMLNPERAERGDSLRAGSVGDGARSRPVQIPQEIRAALRRAKEPNNARRTPNVPQRETLKTASRSSESPLLGYGSAGVRRVKLFADHEDFSVPARIGATLAVQAERVSL
jgi:hypothetical protein